MLTDEGGKYDDFVTNAQRQTKLDYEKEEKKTRRIRRRRKREPVGGLYSTSNINIYGVATRNSSRNSAV